MAKLQGNNTFNNGLNLDFDLMTVGSDMYILSENGRILYSDQASLSWVNAKGNTPAITFEPEVAGNYIPIGYAVINNLLILWIVREDEAIGEIGLVTFDEFGIQNAYQTLMSDNSFTDKFTFTIVNQIEAYGIYENDQCLRTYWVDGVEDDSNPPRTFTFKFDGPDINLATDYSAVTLSPHAVNQQADFNMGIIKFVQSISGSIPAGMYEMSYRLVTADGYATPWYPPTLPLFVTQDSVNALNWNEYEMEGTETFVSTSKGNRWEIKGIDIRYQVIEVAYVHYIADGVPYESNIFVRTTITGTTMTFDHVINNGTPLDPLEIPAQRVAFSGAKTLDFKEEVQYLGNINERFFRLTDAEQEALLVNLTIEPKFRLMSSDTQFLDTTLGAPPDENITFPGRPITHQPPASALLGIEKNLNQSVSENYELVNDYRNYKGTQVSHQFVGFWRGEPYRLGIQFFDEVGNASFTYHIADVTVDDQYGTDLNWTRLKADGTTVSDSFTYGEFFRLTSNATEGEDPIVTGDIVDPTNKLRILGFEIGGLDITSLKSRIKGFMIVRAERDSNILGQGLIMPCVREQSYTTPLPIPIQDWIGDNSTIPMIPSDATGTITLATIKQSKLFYHLENNVSTETNPDDRFKLRPNASVMYMPDVDFDISRFPTAQPADRIKLVGMCGQKNFDAADDAPRHRQWMTYNNYVIQKLDITDNSYHRTALAPYPLFGDQASINSLRLADYGGTPGGKFENYGSTTLTFINSTGIEAGDAGDDNPMAFYSVDNAFGKSDIYAHGKNRTMFIQHNDFGIASSPITYEDRTSLQYSNFFIANYVRPNATPYGGITPSSMEQTRFISTGHFQPVNNPAITCPDVVNEIEIFGGDCYLDYIALARSYGILLENTYQDNDAYSDYGMGVMFPLESDLHHSLRQATNISGVSDNPMYPDVGLKPAKVFYGDDVVTSAVQSGLFLSWDYPGGASKDYGQTVVSESNVEEFNISGVLGLQAILKIYFGELSQFKNIDKYPIRWRYSQNKIYGEPIDKYRQFLANDYRDLQGQYGPITSSKFIFGQIYTFQHKAFGRLRAFDRGALVDQTLGNLYTGLGANLDGVDYISDKFGNLHQWSLISSGKALYWVDAYKRSIMRFAQDGMISLSDDRNVKVFADNAIPDLQFYNQPAQGNGIMSVYDFDNDESIFTFIRTFQEPLSKFTDNIIYNEKTDRFVDTPTFDANFGLSFNDSVYYFNRELANTMYLHNQGNRGEYFGEIKDSKLTIVVNDNASMAKVFDNIRMNINDSVVDMIKEIIMETQNQTETIDMTTDTRWKYLEDILRSPLRTFDQNDRMRGKWIKLTFVFDNTPNAKLIFTNLITLMRPSRRF